MFGKFRKLRGMPTPSGGNALLGHLPVMMKAIKEDQLYIKLYEWAKELGPVYVYWVFSKPTVVVSNPAVIEDLLVRKQKEGAIARHSISKKVWHTVFGGPVMESESGEDWQWRRKAWTPSFSQQQLMENQIALIVGNFKLLVEKIKITAIENKIVEADNVFTGFTMKTICEILFEAKATEADYNKLYEAIGICERQIIAEYSPQKLLKYLPLKSSREYWQAKKYVSEFIDPHVRDSLENVAPTLLTQIAVRGEKYTHESLAAEAFLMIAAGSDTTAHTISFVLGILGTHPEIFAHAQEEVDAVNEINAASLGSLKYVEGVVREALRLYPVGGGSFPCEVREDIEIGGYKIPKGAEIFWSLLAAGRDAGEYPDPDKVIPERWIKDVKELPRTLAFGTGAHRCLGERLAMIEAIVAIALLLRYFEWELVNGLASLDKLTHKFVLSPKDKMPVRFKLR